MAAHTWYEVCAVLTSGGGIADSSVHGTLDSVKAGIARFRALYPNCHLIFVRHHHGAQGKYRVLHRLTVSGGSTAEERRRRAILETLGGMHA